MMRIERFRATIPTGGGSLLDSDNFRAPVVASRRGIVEAEGADWPNKEGA